MKITGFGYSKYRFRLNRPFLSSKTLIAERNGFYVKLHSSKFTSKGDVAPLPEFGSESLNTAENILRELKTSFPYYPADYSTISDIEKLLLEMNSFPALKHGIEQALISLLAKENKTTIADLLNTKSKNEVTLNSVIGLQSPDEVKISVKKQIQEGFKTIKLKAGRINFEEDLKCVEAVRNLGGDSIGIRLDVNGKWDFDQAADNLYKLHNRFDIEYAEQPVSSKEDLIELSKISSIPIAADESIHSLSDALEFIEKIYCPVLVLKPMMVGGILNSLKIIKEAEKNGIKIIISSSFESIIGKKAALFVASSIKDNYVHGLGTDEFFQDGEKLNIVNGMIKIDNPEYFLT